MHLSIHLFFSFIHFVFTYTIYMTALLSNNIHVLSILLLIMILVKLMHVYFGRCILTLAEYNNTFAPIARLNSNMLTRGLTDKQGEEILINVGLLLILNKLFLLTCYFYYKKYKTLI